MMKYILPIVSTVAFPPSFRWMLYLLLFKYKVSADIGARAPCSTMAHIQFTRYTAPGFCPLASMTIPYRKMAINNFDDISRIFFFFLWGGAF